MLRLRYYLILFGVSASLIAQLPGDCVAQTNSVFIESKDVLPGATDVTVGVYISNQVHVVCLIMPLEFREINTGSYMQDHFSRGMPVAGRLWNSPLGGNNPHGRNAIPVQIIYSVPSADINCSGPISRTYQEPAQGMEFTSPDAHLLYTTSDTEIQIPEDIDLDPGTETPGLDIPSYEFKFDVTSVTGQFEIDTCCVRPANHLAFVPRSGAIITPQFTKGIISIGCLCRCHGDPECDGFYDILDVVRTINSAFRDEPAVTDLDCTHARTDVDASGITDIVDVTKMIDVVLNDGSVEGNIVDPCAGL